MTLLLLLMSNILFLISNTLILEWVRMCFQGTKQVEGIIVEIPKAKKVVWLDAKAMTKLRLLILRNNVNVIGTFLCFSKDVNLELGNLSLLKAWKVRL